MREHSVLRRGRRDAPLIGLAAAHAACLCLWPCLAVVALGSWWNANTVSHWFIHGPFFRGRAANAGFSMALSLVLGFPQEVWRRRHLAHHASRRASFGLGPELILDVLAVGALWAALAVLVPWFFLGAYLPGLALGQVLCAVHGHYEHRGGTVVSHHGRLYNLLFLNDGYHAEHHAQPGLDWRRLPGAPFPAAGSARLSRWPAVLRFLEVGWLDVLERIVLGSPALRRVLIERHARAFAALLRDRAGIRRVGVVGGGLFPRTALVLRRVLPRAEIVLIDAHLGHLMTARRLLGGVRVEYRHAWFDPATASEFDLLVVPLAYRGDRRRVYADPPADRVLVHDWLWRRRGEGRRVSWWLAKRVNLIRRPAEADARCRASA